MDGGFSIDEFEPLLNSPILLLLYLGVLFFIFHEGFPEYISKKSAWPKDLRIRINETVLFLVVTTIIWLFVLYNPDKGLANTDTPIEYLTTSAVPSALFGLALTGFSNFRYRFLSALLMTVLVASTVYFSLDDNKLPHLNCDPVISSTYVSKIIDMEYESLALEAVFGEAFVYLDKHYQTQMLSESDKLLLAKYTSYFGNQNSLIVLATTEKRLSVRMRHG